MIRFPDSRLLQPWAHCLPDGWRRVLPALSQLRQQGRVQRTGFPKSKRPGPNFCPSFLPLAPGVQALLLAQALTSQRVPAGLPYELYNYPPIPCACQSLRPSRHQ